MADLERITDDTNITVFENDIDMYLHLFCESNGIENLRHESQNVFNAALIFVGSKLFRGTNVLKDKTPLDGYINNNNINTASYKLNNSDCNRYNTDLVELLCDYYIYLCCKYDKDCTIMGFARLSCIEYNTISAWGSATRGNKLSTAGSRIYEKLTRSREEALVAKLAGNRNPVAVIAILNKHFGYNMPGVKQAESHSRIGTIDDIKQLMIEKSDNAPIDQ
jgi:hypothetical protein